MPRSADLPATCRRCRRSARPTRAAAPILILALTSKTMQPSAIYDAADTVIAQRMSQVDGVAEVTVAGAEQPAIRVRVDPARAVADGPFAWRTCAPRSPMPMRPARSARFDGRQARRTIGINDQLRTPASTTRWS